MQQPAPSSGGGAGDNWPLIAIVITALLSALAFIGRWIFAERDKDRANAQARTDQLVAAKEAQIAGKEALLAEREKSAAALHAQLLEIVQENHAQTLDMLTKQREAHDARYQELLDAQREVEAETRTLATAAVKAVQSLTDKIK